MKISFVIPCYRSEHMIGRVVEEIKTTMEGMPQYTYEVVLINDCSPDNTFGAIKALAEQAASEARRLAEQRRAEADRIAREKAVKAFQERYVHEAFPVAGVTFQNEDKIDRQKILLEISFNEKAETSAWLEEEKPELGEDSGIMVMTDYGCVGYIRRSDKPLARRFEGKTICTSYLSVEQFTNDEGRSIYRADIVFVIDRKSPNQQWYFDDLPES